MTEFKYKKGDTVTFIDAYDFSKVKGEVLTAMIVYYIKGEDGRHHKVVESGIVESE